MSVKATKTTRTRTVEVEEDVVTLEMTEHQAQILVAALRRISGPTSGLRGVLTDEILPPLMLAVGVWNLNCDDLVTGMQIRDGAGITPY